jgi:hypothetical protein
LKNTHLLLAMETGDVAVGTANAVFNDAGVYGVGDVAGVEAASGCAGVKGVLLSEDFGQCSLLSGWTRLPGVNPI